MRTHSFDGVSFFTGLVFVAIGSLYLIPADVSDMIDIFVGARTWLLPVLFLAAGLAILIPTLMSSDSRDGEDTTPDRSTE